MAIKESVLSSFALYFSATVSSITASIPNFSVRCKVAAMYSIDFPFGPTTFI